MLNNSIILQKTILILEKLKVKNKKYIIEYKQRSKTIKIEAFNYS